MKLTKFRHSCVRVADADHRLVIDPGVFSEAAEALTDIDAVLLTHEHPDHVDAAALVAAAAGNPSLHIWAPPAVTEQLSGKPELADRLTAVGPGESFEAGGLPVRTFGGLHAQIHSSLPWVANLAYLVGDAVYHPGDSYVVPTAAVHTVLLPINAPWAKVSETLDFLIAVRAERAFQIHDALLSDIGRGGYESHATRVAGLYGVSTFTHLDPQQTVEL